MAAQRFRIKYLFWLDMAKSDEFAVAEQIEELKQQRTFTKTIRDGIRLLSDLRVGRVDVLLELFPWVKDYFAQPVQPLPITNIEQQLARLEQLMKEGGAVQIERPLPAGPKPLSVPKLAPPLIEDDDQDTIIIRRDTSTDAGMNFLNSMQGLLGN